MARATPRRRHSSSIAKMGRQRPPRVPVSTCLLLLLFLGSSSWAYEEVWGTVGIVGEDGSITWEEDALLPWACQDLLLLDEPCLDDLECATRYCSRSKQVCALGEPEDTLCEHARSACGSLRAEGKRGVGRKSKSRCRGGPRLLKRAAVPLDMGDMLQGLPRSVNLIRFYLANTSVLPLKQPVPLAWAASCARDALSASRNIGTG